VASASRSGGNIPACVVQLVALAGSGAAKLASRTAGAAKTFQQKRIG
jgi:hypothetical protein